MSVIGIYKITNTENGKVYIGQSVDCARRLWQYEHKHNNSSPIDNAIGLAVTNHTENKFTYEIIEKCSIDKLEEREQYWIAYYDCYHHGYNCNEGGGIFKGEDNGHHYLTENDVRFIRQAYNDHKRRKDIYALFQDKIAFNGFAHVWDGTSWPYIMPEVFTEANKEFYKRHATDGELSVSAVLSDAEVIECRKRYVDETAKEIYKDYANRLNYQTLQQILWGRSYKHLDLYKKKEKRWIKGGEY